MCLAKSADPNKGCSASQSSAGSANKSGNVAGRSSELKSSTLNLARKLRISEDT